MKDSFGSVKDKYKYGLTFMFNLYYSITMRGHF